MEDVDLSVEIWKERPEEVEGRPGDMEYESLKKKWFQKENQYCQTPAVHQGW